MLGRNDMVSGVVEVEGHTWLIDGTIAEHR